jgi:putative lipoic acid-binding regulatory protein
MPEEIQDVVKRISEGCYNSTDLQAIAEAVKAEQITVYQAIRQSELVGVLRTRRS